MQDILKQGKIYSQSILELLSSVIGKYDYAMSDLDLFRTDTGSPIFFKKEHQKRKKKNGR